MGKVEELRDRQVSGVLDRDRGEWLGVGAEGVILGECVYILTEQKGRVGASSEDAPVSVKLMQRLAIRIAANPRDKLTKR